MFLSYDYNKEGFYIEDKIGNQTLRLELNEWDYKYNPNTVYYNVVLSLFNKRKHRDENENLCKSTGTHPAVTGIKGYKMFKLLVWRAISEEVRRDWNVVIVVHWVDNRRRDVYARVLKKLGFRFERLSNGKIYLTRKFEINKLDEYWELLDQGGCLDQMMEEGYETNI